MSVKGKHLLAYCPHGINSIMFKPLDKTTAFFKEKRSHLFNGKDYKFVVLFNSRNTHRKHPANLMLAYRMFCDNLPPEESSQCVLLLHTEIIQDAGTDLYATKEAVCPNYAVLFSEQKLPPEDMCVMYNIADITANVSSNEGFGLSIAESIMCGTPVIATVTGGLQDQIGQTDDNGNPIEFTLEFGSNHNGKYKNHGVWAKPVYPAVRTIQGSPPTPYITDDIVKWEDIAEAIMYWYKMGATKRQQCGLAGREWAIGEGGINAKNMCDQFTAAIDFTLNHFVPEKQFSLHTVDEHTGNLQPNNSLGFEIPTINMETIEKDIEETINKL